MEAEVHDSPTCKNCDAPLSGEYCSKCGQRDYDFNRSFREIGADVAESFFNWDTKLIRAVYDLLFHPGVLTKAYLAGKRVSQVPPLRFYLFVSIVFFLVISFEPKNAVRVDRPSEKVRVEDLPLDNATKERIQKSQDTYEARKKANPDSIESRIESFLKDRLSHEREIEEMFASYIPNLVFAMLPVFALITRVVFRKARLGYLSHLVMALHLHSFYFLLFVVERGWAELLGFVSPFLAGVVGFTSFLYTIAYLLIAAQRVFGRTIWGTVWRSAATALAYTISLGLGFLTLLVVVVLIV